jgi:dolichyl-phosphooligosaccharide-protein glycotransferase
MRVSEHMTKKDESSDDISFDFSAIKKFFTKKKTKKATHAKPATQTPEETKENSEDINFNFSSIKNIFKPSKKKNKEKSKEAGFDFGAVGSFVKDHKVLSLLLLVLFLQLIPNFGFMPWGGIYMRTLTADLPVADGWAQGSVDNYYQGQIQQQVRQQYPHLPPDQQKQIIRENYEEFKAANPQVIEQQRNQVADQLRRQYQYSLDGEQYTYVPDIDPYYYMRYAKNLVETGSPADEIREGVAWDTHMIAPVGRPYEHSMHPYVLAGIYYGGSMFGLPDIMQTSAYFPIIFIFLSLIPAFFIGRRIGGNVGGFFTATMISISTAIMGRTTWGHADTDAYNIFFPLMIIWVLLEAYHAKEAKHRIGLAALSGAIMGLYSFAWNGWWYLFDFVVAALGIALIYLLVTNYKKGLHVFKLKEVKDQLSILGAFVASSGILATMIIGFNAFIQAPFRPLGFTNIKEAALKTLWPNVLTTVAELNPGSFNRIVESMGGNVLFSLACIGILLIAFRKTRGHYDIKTGSLLVIWFIGTIYASLTGIRFTLLLAPAFAIALGAFFGLSFNIFLNIGEKELKVPKKYGAVILIVLFATLLIFAKVPERSYQIPTRQDVPIINDAWYDSLQEINQNSQPDAIVNSWWDFGHHFKYISDRAVTFDGASQNKPMAHWIGRSLLTDSETEAIGILRMLDCGSNGAYDEVQRQLGDELDSIKLVKKVILVNETEARSLLLTAGVNAETVLPLTHCSPPENYYIASEDMVSKAGVWGHFGSWNFDRAYMWREVRQLPRFQAVDLMQEKLGYDKEKAEDLYFEMQNIKDENQANQWIAPYPAYMSGFGGCDQRQGGQEIICGNNLVIINGTPYTPAQGGLAPLGSLTYLNENGTLQQETYEGGAPASGLLLPKGNGYRGMLLAPQLDQSIFTKLFFMDGHGLKHFELVSSKQQPSGAMIHVWKVDWEGTQNNVLKAVRQKEIVEDGDSVLVNYIGSFENGTIFNSSIQNWKEEGITTRTDFSNYSTSPLPVKIGSGTVIPGFNDGLLNMTKGESKTITIAPEDGYGTDPARHPLGNRTLVFKLQVERIQDLN